MRTVVGSLALGFAIVSCAQLYTTTSKNPALVQLPPVSHGFAAGDHINLIAVDGMPVGMALTDRDYRRVDPGQRRLAVACEGNKVMLGQHFTSAPLVLNAKLRAGVKYQVICESTDVAVKAFVREQSTGRIVSNTAESSLILASQNGAGPPVLIQIPAVHR